MKNRSVFESKIGFNEIRQRLLSYCVNHDTKSLIEDIQFSTFFDQVNKMLNETWEYLCSIQNPKEQNRIPLLSLPETGFSTLIHKFEKAGSIFTHEDFLLLRLGLLNSQDVYNFFNKTDSTEVESMYPTLKGIAKDLLDPAKYLNIIDAVFDNEGNIRDNASPELLAIRQEQRQISGKVNSVLRKIMANAVAEGHLAENTTPVIREGRLVIPVEAMYKRSMKGIVHGESSTGRTVFIEPGEIVEINNRIRELEAEEQREIIKIFTALTDQLRDYANEIKINLEIIIYFDFLKAKALLARDLNANLPKLHKKPELEWYNAINPNLWFSHQSNQKAVIPLKITLTPQHRILVISGPNAGGKSVTLKTVGIIQYMTQCGLLPPVYSNSHMGLFRDIFIDIGDNQSIENELSTYSSHIRNMRMLLKMASPSVLFLIDEFGSGTEPTIGGAIAEAILIQLNKEKAWGVVTTHYQNLKHIAENTPGLQNGSMLYDRQLMQPLYSLSIGNAGSSFALEIARKAGIPQNIIDHATEIVGQNYVDSDRFLLDINRDRKYWEQKRNEIKVKEKHLDKIIEQWESSASDIKKQRKEILSEAKHEASKLLKDANINIEKTIKEIKEAVAEKERTKNSRLELEKFRKEIENEYLNEINFKHPTLPKKRKSTSSVKTEKPSAVHPKIAVGNLVQLDGSGMTGEILELKGKKAIVNFGLTKTEVDISRLSKSGEKKQQKVKINSILSSESNKAADERRKNFKQSIDVRGMRIDEALQAVTYFIDDAQQFQSSPVRILHGTGTGALRQAIRNYLQSLGANVHFHDEDVRLGGAGITVVEL